ncbi:glycosyltransferase family 4 protein [Aequorivita viscosa]|nr:glycosyltransferase family 4 protein [Aequorivita viscosa]
MSNKIKDRKIVIVNQAVNYLTIGFANAFYQKFEHVVLITGSIHAQGEELSPEIKVDKINQWHERPTRKKIFSFLRALFLMWWLLLTKYRKHEVFFVSVPPMGYLLNLFLPHRFSMVIWDVYPDVFKITGMKESHPMYRFWAYLNKKSFRKAFRLFTISERMADLIKVYTDKEIIIQPIWSIFQENEKVKKEENIFIMEQGLQNKFIVQYSGNIGITHNVEVLVDIAEILKDNDKILFQIIGRGPRKPVLEKLVSDKNLPNCMFLPFQSDEMFPFSLSAADVGVVILDETTSKGSVPSKSYNLMSYGIPSLYIASKDSQLFLYAENYQLGKCFTKNALNQAAEFLENLSRNPISYKNLSNNAALAAMDFKRENADKFVDSYLSEK